jgi:hypothetical protein
MNTTRSSETPDHALRYNPTACHSLNNLPGSRNLYLVPYICEFRKFKTLFLIACRKQAKRIHSTNAHFFFFKSILILSHICAYALQPFATKMCTRFCSLLCILHSLPSNLLVPITPTACLIMAWDRLTTPTVSLTITPCGRIVLNELEMLNKEILISFHAGLIYGHLPGETEGNHS